MYFILPGRHKDESIFPAKYPLKNSFFCRTAHWVLLLFRKTQALHLHHQSPTCFAKPCCYQSMNDLYKRWGQCFQNTYMSKKTEGWKSFVLARTQLLSNSLIHRSFLFFQSKKQILNHQSKTLLLFKTYTLEFEFH